MPKQRPLPYNKPSETALRFVAWEITKQCPLHCRHCRASAEPNSFTDELSTQECFTVLENIATFSQPVIILTGGEPMCRNDIYEIARYGTDLGLTIVMAPCGNYINKDSVVKLINAGIKRISLSIDGADAATHDSFRCSPGSFDMVIKAAEICRQEGLDFQVHTTVTKFNYLQLEDILNLAIDLQAAAFHPFLLVPTGRGKDLWNLTFSQETYETILTWIYNHSQISDLLIKPTCAPHYYRILLQNKHHILHKKTPMTKGCLGGHGFLFISNTGQVQICGFLPVSAGDIRGDRYNLEHIWHNSALFNQIRAVDEYKGKCGICEFRNVCGGCRARAFALTGDYLEAEPFCLHQPKGRKPAIKIDSRR